AKNELPNETAAPHETRDDIAVTELAHRDMASFAALESNTLLSDGSIGFVSQPLQYPPVYGSLHDEIPLFRETPLPKTIRFHLVHSAGSRDASFELAANTA